MKEYMDRNFKKMVDVYLYEVHNEDVGIIDTENPDNSVVYKDITIDESHYYCVKILEFDQDSAPDMDDYRKLFSIHVQSGQS